VNTNIGDDGNLFFCHFCREAGEVVCYDGCPNVFYLAFLPEGPSKKSLNSDDDPWYCHTCLKLNPDENSATLSPKPKRRSKSKRKCETARFYHRIR